MSATATDWTSTCPPPAWPSSRSSSSATNFYGDSEIADLFRRAQAEVRKGGEQGKQLLPSGLSGA